MVTREKADRMLSDVNEGSHFRLHMGTDISNLRQLAEALDIMADTTFSHHINAEKNDFATWVKDSIGDEDLANTIRSVRNRTKMASKVRARLTYLEAKKLQERGGDGNILTSTAGDFALGAVIGFVVGMIMAAVL